MTECSTPLSPDFRVSEETYLEMEKHDYIEKLAANTTLVSLEEYMILRPRPKQKSATMFRRHDDWEPHEIDAGRTIEFRSIGLNLPLDDLYVP